MSDFSLTVKEEGDIVIIQTTGYLNNIGGEKISVPIKRTNFSLL